MKVEKRAVMADGTYLQIEDWTMVEHIKSMIVTCYPEAKRSIYHKERPYDTPYPKREKIFRVSFIFPTREEAERAFQNLVDGNYTLFDYVECYSEWALTKEHLITALSD